MNQGLFQQSQWDQTLEAFVRQRATDWLAEDLGFECDWTSVGLVPADSRSVAAVVVRSEGIVSGLDAGKIVAEVVDTFITWESCSRDGDRAAAGSVIAKMSGPTRSILTAERTILNILGRLCGVATATRLLVDCLQDSACQIFDTRKTVPGWRLLDKYAVRSGGGWNHRMGLYDAILIKDNHLLALQQYGIGPAEAVCRAKSMVNRCFPVDRAEAMVIEIEIDRIDSLSAVLDARPDIVLLDNMGVRELEQAVGIRNRIDPSVVLEASGGVTLENVASLAATGIDRISTGWPTHSSPWLDVALDWL